jgi:lactoylglutathione lyase
VDALTRRLLASGDRAVSGPRQTGDGDYERLVLDPDENKVKITV